MNLNVRGLFLFTFTYGLIIVKVTGQCDDATRPLNVSVSPLPYYISSQNYPENYEVHSDCAWIVTAPSPDSRIIVNIEDVDIEGTSSPCKYDYVTVFDGADDSATELAKICWATRNDVNAIVSSTDTLYITFISDYAVQYRGFNILLFTNNTDYQPACDGSSNLTATTESQYIMSPNFPYEYESNFSCVIRIFPQTLYFGITFNITFLDIEVSKGCVNDALRFVSVGEDSSVDTAVLCTRAEDFEHANFPLDVTGTYIELNFTTDSADNFYGFMLSFTEVFKGINLTSPDNLDTIEIAVPEDLTTGHVNDTVCVIVLTYTGTINLQITPLYESTTNDNITAQDIQVFALIEEQPYVYLDLISTLDYEIISKFTLLATLIDSDVTQVTYTVTFNVTVTDVDDVAPEFLNLPGNYTLSRGQKTDEVIFTINATDNDVSEEFKIILFTIESGDVDSIFAINETTGEVRLTQDAKIIPLTTTQYDLTIGAYSGNLTSVLMTTGDLTIPINPDSPPECSHTSVWGETVDVNTAIAGTEVELIDTWSCTDDNVNLTYSVDAVSPDVTPDLFTIDDVGDVTLLREFNISEVLSRQFMLTIGATDSVGQTTTFSMFMNVTSLSCLPNPRNLYVRMDQGDGDVILNGFNCTSKYGLDYILTQFPAGTFEIDSASNGTVYLILRAPVVKIKFYSLSITITDGVDIAVLKFNVVVQTRRCGLNSATAVFDWKQLFLIMVPFLSYF